ncbi:hypothetical protein FKM82_028817 [Ascaphus truei]
MSPRPRSWDSWENCPGSLPVAAVEPWRVLAEFRVKTTGLRNINLNMYVLSGWKLSLVGKVFVFNTQAYRIHFLYDLLCTVCSWAN